MYGSALFATGNGNIDGILRVKFLRLLFEKGCVPAEYFDNFLWAFSLARKFLTIIVLIILIVITANY